MWQKLNSLKRSRVLKRGKARLEPIAEQHFPFAYAAYRRGIFNHIPDFPGGLHADEVDAQLANTVLVVKEMKGEVWVAIANTSKGEIPLALVTVEYSDGKAFPHALWFPEASYRNKLELGLVRAALCQAIHINHCRAGITHGFMFQDHLGHTIEPAETVRG